MQEKHSSAFRIMRYCPTEKALSILAEESKRLGSPTTGDFAWNLWILVSSSNILSTKTAIKLMVECGYKPFLGYPLIN